MKILKHKEIIIALILGLAIIGYALIGRQTKLDTIREQDRAESEAILKQEEQEAQRKRSLKLCLSNAEEKKRDIWVRSCEHEGTRIEKDSDGEITNCWLPDRLSDDFTAREQKEKDRCTELYK